MNADILRSAGIDYDRGVKRFAGRAQLFEKALRKFSIDTTFQRISAAYQIGDRELLLSSAHEFKGMCGNVSLDPLYGSASDIVSLLRSGSFTDMELENAFVSLSSAYERIHGAILLAMEDEA